jgi:hypothetical protein
MTNKDLLPSRKDSISGGSPLYGEISEITGEGLVEGTIVSALSVEGASVVLSSFTERKLFLNERRYRRSIERDIESTARLIDHTAKITSS